MLNLKDTKEGAMNVSTACRKRIRSTAISAVRVALGLSLIMSSYAQNQNSKQNQKGINIMQTTAATGPGVDWDASIRPFHVNIPQEKLDDLRRRIKATIWPERENVPDATQGVQLATMKKLAEYWANYDWRKFASSHLPRLPRANHTG